MGSAFGRLQGRVRDSRWHAGSAGTETSTRAQQPSPQRGWGSATRRPGSASAARGAFEDRPGSSKGPTPPVMLATHHHMAAADPARIGQNAGDALAAPLGALQLAPQAAEPADAGWQAAAAQELAAAHPWAGGVFSCPYASKPGTSILLTSVHPPARARTILHLADRRTERCSTEILRSCSRC